ncbi:MAG: ribulose-phosphate 3-epimerase [Peptococcaceae bacterium]|jgi:ribulose-phosphate 3-epimerase|nr:ribulose-phosphate 3-epimerase [Peptococcaceae bacterium]
MIEIAPSILSADFAKLADQIEKVERAGARILHIDVMDGHFVPNITLGPLIVQSLRPHSGLRFDAHLMIENPERYIEDFARAGADHITVHWEATKHIHRLAQQIKAAGCTAGVAFNPTTPLDGLEFVVQELDFVLLMSVNPGFGGQKLIEAVLPKIGDLRRRLDAWGRRDCLIEVDGGIQAGNIAKVVEVGAEILVAGASVFGREDPVQAYRELCEAACGRSA